MYTSSDFRCGSCLSKYNGKSWEESYMCVLPVKSWSPVLNEKYQLCVQGLCDINLNLSVCIPITNRLNSFWVTSDSTLVKLRGNLNAEALPEYITRQFAHGIPTNWKEIVKKWIDFVQRGEQSTFSWEQDESFDSFNSAHLITRSRRVVTSGRNTDGKSKEKSIQRTTDLSEVAEQERDSAVPTSEDCSSKHQQPTSPPSIWHSVSPQLPAHKVKEIFQWIDIAHLSNQPLGDAEGGCKDPGAEFIAPSSDMLIPKNRVPNSESVPQTSNNRIPQSTPINTGWSSHIKEGAPSWNLSSIYNSSLNHSITLGSMASDVLGKSNVQSHPKKNNPKNTPEISHSDAQILPPNTEVPVDSANSTSSDQPLRNFVSENVFRKPTRGRNPKAISKSVQGRMPRHGSKNAEVPGSRMGRMLSSSIRPRRRQTVQKIERWRPVLGVDGCLKVQGYLLLQSDMTAGQILTTNTVVDWGERRVVTCDGREYELVGDPNGKIPDELKCQLFKPLDCADITVKLLKYQGLKDRSDWGAEYDFFYGDENESRRETPDAGNSRMTHSLRNNRRTTSRNTSLARQRNKSGAQVLNSQEAANVSTSETLRSTTRKNIVCGPQQSTLPNSESPSSKRTRSQNNSSNLNSLTSKSTCIMSGFNQSKNSGSSKKVDRNGLNTSNPNDVQKKENGSETDNNHLAFLSNNQQDKENNYIRKSSTDATRSCFENITWKNTQNQMMLPSPRLSADSSNVDFSSSRIKVSYITSGTKSNQNCKQNSPESISRNLPINVSTSSGECTPKSRPSRSPTKRTCFPCLQDYKSRTASNSPSLSRSLIPHRTSFGNTTVQVEEKPSSPVCQTRSRRKSSYQVKKTPVKKDIACRSLNSSSHQTTRATSLRSKSPKSSKSCPPSPKSLRSSSRTTSRMLRVIVQRLDTGNTFQKKTSPKKKSVSVSPKRKSVIKVSKEKSPKTSKKSKKMVNVLVATNTLKNKKPVEAKNKKDEEKKTKNKKDEKKNKNKKNEVKQNKNEEKKAKNKKTTANKIITITSEESSGVDSDDADDASSECSSDSSVGPSASMIFEFNNSSGNRRAPRTLRERRERDAKIAEMGKKLVAKETSGIDADDDPMADIIASRKFSPLNPEWCRHENILGKSRKRRRPSSSEGTVSPSRSGLSDGYGNEDATSSVATPQLLMRPPDPKQVQSYLQRQKAWNAKPQRPTRQSKRADGKLMLPHIDYAAVFRPATSDSEECASEVSLANSDWEA